MELFHQLVKISILPLGVWILYFFLRKKKETWQSYRHFAWLGFFANFIFLAATLASVPLQKAMYPEKELATYVANWEHAKVITLHPSASDAKLDKNHLKSQMISMNSKKVEMINWYDNIVNIDIKQEDRIEKFPYQLTGTLPKRGSGLHTLIYVEKDGKGLLITTPQNQFYYRSDQSILTEEAGR
jgi:hypothetical protein